MPGWQYNNLWGLAEARMGYVTLAEARLAGLPKETLMSMQRRGTVERVAHGVYRFINFPVSPLAHYVEASLWPAGATGVVSHQSALALYELSDINPNRIHITVPRAHRVRRAIPKNMVMHHDDIPSIETQIYEGVLASVPARAIRECHANHVGEALLRQAVEAGRESGHLTHHEADDLLQILLK